MHREAPMNRPACARLENAHTGRAGVRSPSPRTICKKLGAHCRRKAALGNPRMRVATATVGGPTSVPAALLPGRPGKSPQEPTLNQLAAQPAQINGKIHDQADRAGRQELQVVCSGIGHTGNHGSATPALVGGGRCQIPSAIPSFKHFFKARQAARPNHSLNRTFCCGPHLG